MTVGQLAFLAISNISKFSSLTAGNMLAFRPIRRSHVATTVMILSASSIICPVFLCHQSIVSFEKTGAVASRKSVASTSAVDAGKKHFTKTGLITFEGVQCELQIDVSKMETCAKYIRGVCRFSGILV
jgi:hypothetical protein